MQHPTSRPRRVRRVIAISAAAVAVMIAPTACDYGGPAQMDMTGHSGHMDGMDMDAPVQEHQVVQVGNTRSSTPATDAAATASTAEAQRVASERRRGDDDRRRGEDGRGRGRGNQTTSATTAPAGATSTTTTAPTAATSVPPPPRPQATATSTAAAPSRAPTTASTSSDSSCADSKRRLPHTGFQSGDAQCVSTAMGEVAAENQLPSLLITGRAAVRAGRNEPFKLKVSTRNLVRDRFLGAAAGGYYLESSFLNKATVCSAATSTPRAGSCRRPAAAPDSGTLPSSSSRPRTTAVARSRTP